MKGLIFNIRKYSVHDGPGIRVTVFLKGCPLGCLWCHNPEGISSLPQTVIQTRRVGQKEFSNTENAGTYYSVENVLEIIEGEKVFITKSGGGVTFSGGEPMLQHEFLLEALKTCKSTGYHTAIDTSGYCPHENIQSVIPYTDLFLFDIKHLDDTLHTKYTGVSNRLILENYQLVLRSKTDMMIRFPVIPGYNDDPEHLDRLRQFINETKSGSLKKICLLPFHKTGASKYNRFRMPYRLRQIEQPSAQRMNELKEFFSETGIKVKIGG
jgi:pyruvate formate lyase activating enzyme